MISKSERLNDMKKIFVSMLSVLAYVGAFAAEISAPWGGSTEIKGTGKFAFRNAKIALKPGKSYRFDFKMSKIPPLSAKKIEHQLVLYSILNNKPKAIKNMAAEVPADGKVYQVTSVFTIPADAQGDIMLFAYNCFAKGTVKISDFKVTDAENVQPVNSAVTAVQQVAETSDTKSDEILPSFSNRKRALLEGNGRFLFLEESLQFKPATKYSISFEICKIGPLSPKTIEHRLVLAFIDENGKYSEFGLFGEKIPVDGKWHTVNSTFTTPAANGKYKMYIYNCNADGSMEIKKIRITPSRQPAPWGKDEVFAVKGNGKFLGKNFHISVKANSVVNISFKMMKTPQMSANPVEQRMVIAYIPKNGNIREIAWLGEKIPADSKWHELKHSLKVPADSNGTLRVIVYNCKASGTISVKDFEYK